MIAKTFMFGCGGTFLDAHGGSAATVKRVAASALLALMGVVRVSVS